MERKVFQIDQEDWDEFPDGTAELQFDGSSWRNLRKKIPCKPFRGFRYKWW